MKLQRIGKNIVWPVEQLHLWVAEGKTHAEIADILELNPKLVSKACIRFGVKSQRRGPRSGPDHPEWKGGVQYDKHGYRLVWVGEDDPMACMARKRGQGRRDGYGYVPEHRLVMARYLGRPLDQKEVVHHKNGDPQDNCIENLELFSCNAEHLRHELTGRVPNWSEDGKRRIREGQKTKAANRLRREQDALLRNQTIPLLTEESDRSEPHASDTDALPQQ